MTKDEIIKDMLEKNQILMVGDEYYPVTRSSIIEAETKKKATAKNDGKWAKNLPHHYKNVAKAVAYTSLVSDATIPPYSNGDLNYMLPTQNMKAEKVLYSIIKNVEIDFQTFIFSLKVYYQSGPKAVKIPLAKLLVEGGWRHIYENAGISIDKPGNTMWK